MFRSPATGLSDQDDDLYDDTGALIEVPYFKVLMITLAHESDIPSSYHGDDPSNPGISLLLFTSFYYYITLTSSQ